MAKYKIIPSTRTIVQSPISIGHKAEKGVEAIEFDLTAWVETYGSGTLTVIMRRWGDAIPYPIALEIDENNKATWTLSDTDTAKAGMAYAQLSYIVGDEVVKKSDIYTFRVMDSLTGEGDPPEAYESWLEHLTHFAAEAMAEVLDIEGVVTDKTLTVDGGIADAKATGDALALKADKSTTYTKTEVDQMIEDVEVETDTTLEVAGAAADAAETGRQIGLLKADFSDSQIITDVNFSDRETGYYVNNNGVKTALNGTFISAPVSVKAGQKIILYIASYTSICIIAKYDNNTYTPLLVSTATDYNNAYLYEYTVTEDCDVVFSGYDRNGYYAKIVLPVQNALNSTNARVTALENQNRRTANVEPVEIGYYINSRGSKVPLGTSTRGGVVTAPIYLEKGETLTVYAFSYNTMSAIALIVGDTYKPVVLGDDTYEEVYKPYTYKAEFDCFVVVSGFSHFPPYGYIEKKYEVKHLPFDNLLDGAGLASAYDTMGFIGDSISSGECYSNEGGTNTAHDIYAVSWGQYLAKMCGATGYNWSRGGQTSKTWLAEWSNNALFTDHPCKMYCIGLGQNDGYDLTDSRAVPIGTTADVGTDAETFYGLYSKIIRRVKEIQPKAHIFVITNIIQQIEDHGYNDAIRYMATIYDNVFLLDYYVYGQNALNSPLMLSQKRLGHYTALGYRVMAQYISTYIDWYIRNNPEKFTQIEFIGTAWSWT